MPVFQHILWGYEFTYPDGWIHQTIQDTEGFAASPEAFEADYDGADGGHLLVKAEWNGVRQTIGPLWTRHIGMLAGMLGARKVGSAPWSISGAVGLEADILLPKKGNTRLWTGILALDYLVLQFVVVHPKKARRFFEPHATKIIRSLKFIEGAPGIQRNELGLPLPPGYINTDPRSIVPDIQASAAWSAYTGESPCDALQAFFIRAAPAYGWSIQEYLPFPGPADLGFARMQLTQAERKLTLGIMPVGEGSVSAASPGKLVIKLE